MFTENCSFIIQTRRSWYIHSDAHTSHTPSCTQGGKPIGLQMGASIKGLTLSYQNINRSHAHAHDSRTYESRTNHSHEHRANNGATTLNSRSRRRRLQDRRCRNHGIFTPTLIPATPRFPYPGGQAHRAQGGCVHQGTHPLL